MRILSIITIEYKTHPVKCVTAYRVQPNLSTNSDNLQLPRLCLKPYINPQLASQQTFLFKGLYSCLGWVDTSNAICCFILLVFDLYLDWTLLLLLDFLGSYRYWRELGWSRAAFVRFCCRKYELQVSFSENCFIFD